MEENFWEERREGRREKIEGETSEKRKEETKEKVRKKKRNFKTLTRFYIGTKPGQKEKTEISEISRL